jgi:hypothetical protein
MSDHKVKRYEIAGEWVHKGERSVASEIMVMASDFDAVVQELRKQVEEQKQWMRHKQNCVYYAAWDGTVPPCSCGLSAYLGEG